MPLPETVSESTRRLNPQIFGTVEQSQGIIAATVEKHRMRQNRGPKENKTEAAFHAWLAGQFRESTIYREGVTLLLANGLRYTADFAIFNATGELVLYEVKGPHAWEDSLVKLKVAASVYPTVSFCLASPADKTKTSWRIERVYP